MKRTLAFVMACIGVSAFAGTPKMWAYKIQSPGGRMFVSGINKSGQIVGTWLSSVGYVAFVTGPIGQGITNIVIAGADSTDANGINDYGVVVGTYYINDPGLNAPFVYTPAQGAKALLSHNPSPDTRATDINNNNEIVGNTWRFGGDYIVNTPYMWNTDGEILSTFPDLPPSSYVSAINDDGQATGTHAAPPDGYLTAFVTGKAGGGVTYVGVTQGMGNAINSVGDIAGTLSDRAFSTRHGPDTPYIRDATIDVISSVALAIGPQGKIGGRYYMRGAPYDSLAFVANAKGEITDLGNLVVNRSSPTLKFVSVKAINSRLQLAVEGNDGNGYIVCPTKNCR